MAFHIVPYRQEHVAAVRAFNQRMRAGRASTEFLLPDEPPRSGVHTAIRWTHFLAMAGNEVHGGVLEMDQPAWLCGAEVRAANYQSPLSEGVLNRRFAGVGPLLMRYAQSRSPYAFMVGMGTQSNALPRMLKAGGWPVRAVPFFFRVHRAARFLTEIRVAHATLLRSAAARTAAVSGIGSAALAAAQWRRGGTAGYTAREAAGWGNWAEEIWTQFCPHCSFAVLRDVPTLEELYPAADPRMLVFRIEQEGWPRGWAACFLTRMHQSRHFGNLCVGSVLDCVAGPQAMAAVARITDDELAKRGADVVVTNQSHALWGAAFRQAGFLRGPSNYMLAMSKTLSAAIREAPGGEARIHITRGDGDGRLNL